MEDKYFHIIEQQIISNFLFIIYNIMKQNIFIDNIIKSKKDNSNYKPNIQ